MIDSSLGNREDEMGQKRAWSSLASSLLEPSGLLPSSSPLASSLWEPRAEPLLTTLFLFSLCSLFWW